MSELEEHSQQGTSLAPSILLVMAALTAFVACQEAECGEAPLPSPLKRGPYLQGLLDSSVLIAWDSEEAVVGAVEYAKSGGESRVLAELQPETSHRIRLEDLAPGEVHEYRILHDGKPVLPFSPRFRTAPARGKGTIRLAVVGDSGDGSEETYRVAEVIRRSEPEILLHTGDFDYIDDLDAALFTPYQDILRRSCLFPALGNHDIRSPWLGVFSPPMEGPIQPSIRYYSFDWGPVHFVALDTEAYLEDGAQEEWLKTDLAAAAASGIPWKMVFSHRPPFTVGSHAGLPWIMALRDRVAPIAARYGVDLFLSGHDHNYQRSYPVRSEERIAGQEPALVVRDGWQSPRYVRPRGTIYLVTGGGGGALYGSGGRGDRPFIELFISRHHALEIEVDPSRLRVRAIAPGDEVAIAPGDEVIDEFTIEKEGPSPLFTFLRGDTDAGGPPGINDAIRILDHLFLGRRLVCLAPADVNNDHMLDITDPVYLLDHLFLGGRSPPEPYPHCGPDPQADDAFCGRTGCPR